VGRTEGRSNGGLLDYSIVRLLRDGWIVGLFDAGAWPHLLDGHVPRQALAELHHHCHTAHKQKYAKNTKPPHPRESPRGLEMSPYSHHPGSQSHVSVCGEGAYWQWRRR
jgi:hypothetical protein